MKALLDALVERLNSDYRLDFVEKAGIVQNDGGVEEEEVILAYTICNILHRYPLAFSGVTVLQAQREGQTRYVLTTDTEGAYRHLSSAGWTVSEVHDLSSVLDEKFGGIALIRIHPAL